MLNQLPSSTDPKDDSIIQVRVIRLWDNHVWEKPDQIISKDMILIDQQSNMVHGSILKKHIYRFERYISQGKCYVITNVSVGIYSQKYRYVDNSKKINLYLRSQIKPCEDFGGDLYAFRFYDIESLYNRVTSTDTIVDVVGYVSSYKPIKDITKANA